MSGHTSPSLLLNDEQKMLSKTAHEFIRERAPAARIRTFRDSNDEVGFSRELWNEMAELGWLGLQIPEEYDGLGLGFMIDMNAMDGGIGSQEQIHFIGPGNHRGVIPQPHLDRRSPGNPTPQTLDHIHFSHVP